MAWVALLLAGVLEVVWAVGMKYTQGFTRLWPSVMTGVAALLSIYLLAQAIKVIPVGTAYAVWTGIGVIGTVVFGILLLGESASVFRMLCLVLIVAGIVGLKILTPA
ncbi:MAG: quaternary ammonium compound efflux SMR transporter SugE [Candidatus Omnitrophota bacterium]|nr:quaternary ammonium compound efflux SMR transporter SugE [Candidatus Omnitrophota bacterium]